MEQEYRHAIALMRYSAIAPLIPGLPEEIGRASCRERVYQPV